MSDVNLFPYVLVGLGLICIIIAIYVIIIRWVLRINTAIYNQERQIQLLTQIAASLSKTTEMNSSSNASVSSTEIEKLDMLYERGTITFDEYKKRRDAHSNSGT